MPKNIVICCDGTDNQLTLDSKTNVLHLYSCLKKSDKQVAYYNPGVGTLAPEGVKSSLLRAWFKLKDSMSATSLVEDVIQAYKYLMNIYDDGDEIYLFGFSRGAYTVRMLHGLIYAYGLLDKGNEPHLRYVLEEYNRNDNKFHIANSFKKRFSKSVDFKFMGIWDTVVSIGNPFSFYKGFQYTSDLKGVDVVRHCMAIDERRKHYKVSHIKPTSNHTETYFAGVHSDIGGSYKEIESGLSKVTLEYMMGEASANGLILDKDKVSEYLYGNHPDYVRPDITQKIHNSLTLLFTIADFFPRIRYSEKSMLPFNMKFDFSLWPRRKIIKGATIHKSVFEKVKQTNYNPKNLLNEEYYMLEGNMPIQYL